MANLTTEQEQGFWTLQRAFNYLMQYQPFETSALRQIANLQAEVLDARPHRNLPMFELLQHRNKAVSNG